MTVTYSPTQEQTAVIDCAHGAFISACPGAGKTRTLVERARKLIKNVPNRQGIAFLSFTNAAVTELQEGLQREGLLPTPAMPHFIGTFDSFIWHFLVAPLGIPGCAVAPRLVQDKNGWTVRPFSSAQPVTLKCFDRHTGAIDAKLAAREGFIVAQKGRVVPSYEASAKTTVARALERGEVDFSDARAIAKQWLADAAVAARMKRVLAARFFEVVVDEAQDCNSADLAIVGWFRSIGIVTKVICDPEQAIYGFRGGVGAELKRFGETFPPEQQLPMKGNFRSTENICKAIAAFREPAAQATVDQALGKFKADQTPVHVICYPGTGVPATIGTKYSEIVVSLGLHLLECPVLAKTWDSAGKAIGQPIIGDTDHMTLNLASAVTKFHFAFDSGSQKKALEQAHVAILDVEGLLGDRGYQHYLHSNGLDGIAWRPRVLSILRELRYDPANFADAAGWLARARALLAPTLAVQGSTINQRLKSHADLAGALSTPSATSAPALSIHSVKGKQFPGVCVVMTVASAKGILDFLDTGQPADSAEDAREIYVAASRAERLLAFAIPKSRAERLTKRLTDKGVPVIEHQL